MNRSQTIFVGGLGALALSSLVALSQSRSASLEALPVQSGAVMPTPSATVNQTVVPSPAPLPIAPPPSTQPAAQLTSPPPVHRQLLFQIQP